MKTDPLKPPLSLLCKLGSIAVHADEMISRKSHAYDLTVCSQLLLDPEVTTWMREMKVYLPVKR